MKHIQRFVMILLMSGISTTAGAQDNMAKAMAFFEQLDTNNMEGLGEFLSDDVVFQDPTFGARYEKKETVMQVYSGYAAGASNVQRLLLSSFESKGTVVTTWIMAADMIPYIGAPDEHRVATIGKIVRALEFNADGKIVQHIDLGDYSEIIPKIMAAREKYMPKEGK